MWNLFKINNTDTRTTPSILAFCCWLWTSKVGLAPPHFSLASTSYLSNDLLQTFIKNLTTLKVIHHGQSHSLISYIIFYYSVIGNGRNIIFARTQFQTGSKVKWGLRIQIMFAVLNMNYKSARNCYIAF